MRQSILFYLILFTSLDFYSAIIPSGTYNDSGIKSLLGSDATLEIEDATTVEIDGAWDFTQGVNTDLVVEIIGSGSLVFNGNGASKSEIIMLSSQGILIQNNMNTTAINNTANGGNIRITLGTTTYQGNDFSSIISAGGIGSVLPVEFGYLRSNSDKGIVNVEWNTLTEINADYFEILTSYDLINYDSQGTVTAAGFSKSEIEYSHEFTASKTGVLYIKIRQYDFNGEFIETNIITVNVSQVGNEVEVVYPNPCNYTLTIGVEYSDIRVVNGEGELQDISLSMNNTIDTSNLPLGTYIIFLDGNPTRFVVKH